jgi:hypothetical protein
MEIFVEFDFEIKAKKEGQFVKCMILEEIILNSLVMLSNQQISNLSILPCLIPFSY